VRGDLCQEFRVRTGRDDFAARRAIVPFRNCAGLDQELFDHFDANAGLLGGGDDGMQAALGDGFADQRFPGRDGPVIEDAVAQDAAEHREAGLLQVVPVQGGIHRAEDLPGRVERTRGRGRDPVERRADRGLALAGDLEAGRVIGAVRAVHVPKLRGTESASQEPAEGRGGEQRLILQPCVVRTVLKPRVQPEIIGGGELRRPVEGARKDVTFNLAQACRHVVTVGESVGPPELDQRMAVPDADEGLPHLPVPAHRHGGGRWSLVTCRVLA
jgi:hypothetical protein